MAIAKVFIRNGIRGLRCCYLPFDGVETGIIRSFPSWIIGICTGCYQLIKCLAIVRNIRFPWHCYGIDGKIGRTSKSVIPITIITIGITDIRIRWPINSSCRTSIKSSSQHRAGMANRTSIITAYAGYDFRYPCKPCTGLGLADRGTPRHGWRRERNQTLLIFWHYIFYHLIVVAGEHTKEDGGENSGEEELFHMGIFVLFAERWYSGEDIGSIFNRHGYTMGCVRADGYAIMFCADGCATMLCADVYEPTFCRGASYVVMELPIARYDIFNLLKRTGRCNRLRTI